MPRTPHVEFAGAVFHVMNRGLERRAIVRDNLDRHTWWRMLDRAATRYAWRVFAYALLDNHFHLFLRITDANLGLGMRDFESGFATLFNKRYERDGPLFRGRYKPILVEFDSHAWELSRYIHLNPVRAGLTDDPRKYKWSSYRYYLNPAGAPGWLDWKTVLAEFGGTESQARLAYKRFVEAGMSDPPPNPLDDAVDGWISGSDKFAKQILGMDANEEVEVSPEGLTVDQIVDAVAAVFEVPAEQVRCRGRQVNLAREAALLLTRELTSETIVELGTKFGGVGGSAVSETVRRARQRAKSDGQFRERLERLWFELR